MKNGSKKRKQNAGKNPEAKKAKKVKKSPISLDSNWKKLIQTSGAKVNKKQANVVKSNSKTSNKPLKDPKPKRYQCKHPLNKKFITPQHPDFVECVKTSYVGFVREKSIKSKLEAKVAKGLEEMRRNGLFHYDCVQYGSTVNSTLVQRTLVGEPGITYLYQKLRLFALPWNDKSIANGSLLTIKELNTSMTARAKTLIGKYSAKGGHEAGCAGVGRCDFNLTLINAALTNTTKFADKTKGSTQPVLNFKKEKLFGMGDCAVNWHRDSSLVPFSTIGVYHHTPDKNSTSWKVAMCVDDISNKRDGDVTEEKKTPAVAVSLKDGESYFMLGNFNHHHQHAVLAGTDARYASTHRVAVEGTDTWGYISKKCNMILGENGSKLKGALSDIKQIEKIEKLHSELEFEWIRQFWVQGAVHAKQQSTYWKPKIEQLTKYWLLLEKHTKMCVMELESAAKQQKNTVTKRHYKIVAYLLKDRLDNRIVWRKRYRDTVYSKLPKEYQPIEKPNTFDVGLPWDLKGPINRMKQAEAMVKQ